MKSETVSRLSRKYQVISKQMKEWNKLNSHYIFEIGQKMHVN
ncbi:LysM peptidoglycan-binding domain-containing protein [Peribacillus simplex]